ncbi:MAG: coproporphyrinogen dehydrogenase HemZ, partial [Oscillospiraceae bacterium]
MFTIFFSGQTYKYELESITKLFYPVVRFNFEYDKIDFSSEGIVTRLKKGKAYYYLWVRANINGVTKRLSAKTTDFSDCERILCVLLYKVLSQITGIKPTWGILTGIRPVLNFKK